MYYTEVKGHRVEVNGQGIIDFITDHLMPKLPVHVTTIWKYWEYVCSTDTLYLIQDVSVLLNKFYTDMHYTHVQAMELSDVPIVDILHKVHGEGTHNVYNLGMLLLRKAKFSGHDLALLHVV